MSMTKNSGIRLTVCRPARVGRMYRCPGGVRIAGRGGKNSKWSKSKGSSKNRFFPIASLVPYSKKILVFRRPLTFVLRYEGGLVFDLLGGIAGILEHSGYAVVADEMHGADYNKVVLPVVYKTDNRFRPVPVSLHE